MHACITTKVIIIISKRQLFHKWRSLLHHICHLRFASCHRRPPPVTSGENIEIVWPTVFLVKETIARRWRMNLNKAGVKVPVVLR